MTGECREDAAVLAIRRDVAAAKARSGEANERTARDDEPQADEGPNADAEMADGLAKPSKPVALFHGLSVLVTDLNTLCQVSVKGGVAARHSGYQKIT